MTTKIHVAADMACRPVSRVTSAGQRHDTLAFTAVLGGVRIHRAAGGRPRTRPDRVLADKAYSTATIPDRLCRRGIKATIPQPSNKIKGRLACSSDRAGATPPTPRQAKLSGAFRSASRRGMGRLR